MSHRRSATIVTSSAAGMSPWNALVAATTASTTSRRTVPCALDDRDQPLVAEPLAGRRAGVGHAIGVEQDQVARGERQLAGHEVEGRNAPISGPDPVSQLIGRPSAGTIRGGSWPALPTRRTWVRRSRTRRERRDEQGGPPLLDEDRVRPLERDGRARALVDRGADAAAGRTP